MPIQPVWLYQGEFLWEAMLQIIFMENKMEWKRNENTLF